MCVFRLHYNFLFNFINISRTFQFEDDAKINKNFIGDIDKCSMKTKISSSVSVNISNYQITARKILVDAVFGADKNQMVLFHCDDGWLARLCSDRLRDVYGYQNVKAATLRQLQSMKFWNKSLPPISLLGKQLNNTSNGHD